MKKFFEDFKKFISRGNIVDMAIGVIVGNAFSAIVKAFTDKIIMPLINWMLSCNANNGLESAYTFLKCVYSEDNSIDLTKSIYIDWGAFITAILNFFIIAMTLFIILKVAIKSNQVITKAKSKILKLKPTPEERKVLKERGFKKSNLKEYNAALQEYRKEVATKKAEEEKNKPKVETDLDILKDIRELLKAQNTLESKTTQTSEEVEK